MKKTIYLMIVLVLLVTACQPKTKIVPVDKEAARVAVAALLDKYDVAFKAKDSPSLISLLTTDGLFCGTDPTEIWDFNQISNGWTQAFADAAYKIDYTVNKREIRIAADGNSAIAMQQLFMKMVSPKIEWRIIFHIVKSAGDWKIDFISWNFIPKNEEIEKLNKALE